MTIDLIVSHHLDAVDWAGVRVVAGEPALEVPKALQQLVAATSEAEAERRTGSSTTVWLCKGSCSTRRRCSCPRCWLRSLVRPLRSRERTSLIFLSRSLAVEADQSEVARGNRALGAEARRAAREGVWLAYRLAAHPAAQVRERALFIIHAADPDRDRVAQ